MGPGSQSRDRLCATDGQQVWRSHMFRVAARACRPWAWL